MHASALQPEHADTIADVRPFGIEIGLDEGLGEQAHVQRRGFAMRPVDAAVSNQRDGAGQGQRLAGKVAQMVGGVLERGRFVKASAVDADDAVAADHPIVRMVRAHIQRLALRELRGDRHRIAGPGLERALVDVRSDGAMFDARRLQHLPPDCAGRGEDQGQSNNLVDKDRRKASASMGAHSTGG